MASRDRIERVAVEAALAGGRYLRAAFEREATEATHLEHDVKSSADTEAERRMLDVVTDAFPAHEIHAEESGMTPGDGFRWIVDPLDGTNNFESGLPTFASAVTVRDRDAARTEVAVAYAPLVEDLYVARRGDGLRRNGRRVETTANDLAPARATVVTVVGHDVKRTDEAWRTAEAMHRAVERGCKRRVESWAPTVHWGRLADGRLDGVVCYRPDAEEQHLGELFAAETGLITEGGEEWFVAATRRDLHRELRAVVESTIAP